MKTQPDEYLAECIKCEYRYPAQFPACPECNSIERRRAEDTSEGKPTCTRRLFLIIVAAALVVSLASVVGLLSYSSPTRAIKMVLSDQSDSERAVLEIASSAHDRAIAYTVSLAMDRRRVSQMAPSDQDDLVLLLVLWHRNRPDLVSRDTVFECSSFASDGSRARQEVRLLLLDVLLGY